MSFQMGNELRQVMKQSGVIPYRIRNGGIEVLLITSSSGKHWVIPKGWVELFWTSANSAAKEAWEEAGITGTVITPAIGTYPTRHWNCIVHVEVFLMQVESEADQYPEVKKRDREWVSLAKATKRLQNAELKALVGQLHELIQVEQAEG